RLRFFRPAPPGAALSVDGSFAANRNVVQIAPGEQAAEVHAFGALPAGEHDRIIGRVGAEEDRRILIQVQPDVGAKLQGTGEIFARGEIHDSPTALFGGVEGGADRLRVVA